MRKPRDYDAELKTLTERAKLLRDRKLVQLGELTVATGADVLPIEMLAGAMLAAARTNESATKEAWRKEGAAFFQRAKRNTEGSAGRRAGGGQTSAGGAQPAAPNAGTP